LVIDKRKYSFAYAFLLIPFLDVYDICIIARAQCFFFYSKLECILYALAVSSRYQPQFTYPRQIVTAASSEYSTTLTKRDCIHLHGGGQPVPPTLDLSGGSSHSRS